MDYTSTTRHKVLFASSGLLAATLELIQLAGIFSNTAAITRVALTVAAAQFATGSRVTLYGIN